MSYAYRLTVFVMVAVCAQQGSSELLARATGRSEGKTKDVIKVDERASSWFSFAASFIEAPMQPRGSMGASKSIESTQRSGAKDFRFQAAFLQSAGNETAGDTPSTAQMGGTSANAMPSVVLPAPTEIQTSDVKKKSVDILVFPPYTKNIRVSSYEVYVNLRGDTPDFEAFGHTVEIHCHDLCNGRTRLHIDKYTNMKGERVPLEAGTTYMFRLKITAKDSPDAQSKFSFWGRFTTMDSSLPAVPELTSISHIDTNSVEIHFKRAADVGLSALIGFKIYTAKGAQDFNNGEFYKIHDGGRFDFVYDKFRLAPATKYTFKVASVSKLGEGATSNSKSATTLAEQNGVIYNTDDHGFLKSVKMNARDIPWIRENKAPVSIYGKRYGLPGLPARGDTEELFQSVDDAKSAESVPSADPAGGSAEEPSPP